MKCNFLALILKDLGNGNPLRKIFIFHESETQNKLRIFCEIKTFSSNPPKVKKKQPPKIFLAFQEM